MAMGPPWKEKNGTDGAVSTHQQRVPSLASPDSRVKTDFEDVIKILVLLNHIFFVD
jgi:hypothetical protein